MSKIKLSEAFIKDRVKLALTEDLYPYGDITSKLLKDNKIISKKYLKLKILGDGELKEKIDISANYISKQAKNKIEKIGGKLNIIKK